jgi:hypothetical protein
LRSQAVSDRVHMPARRGPILQIRVRVDPDGPPAQDLEQQGVAVGSRVRAALEDDDGVQSEAVRAGYALDAVVGLLSAPAGDDDIAALVYRFPKDELHGPGLVAAQGDSRQVVPFDEKPVQACQRRQVRHLLKSGGQDRHPLARKRVDARPELVGRQRCLADGHGRPAPLTRATAEISTWKSGRPRDEI